LAEGFFFYVTKSPYKYYWRNSFCFFIKILKTMKHFATVILYCILLCGFILTVQAAPVITRQPQPEHVCEGKIILLEVRTEGEQLSYQWQKDSVDIPGATDSVYTIQQAKPDDAGGYRVVITSGNETVVSQNAVVYVNHATRVIHHPENAKVPLGGTARFKAEFEVVEPATYQWYNSKGILKDDGRIYGATSSVLTIRNIDTADTAERYYVVARGLCGSDTSTLAYVYTPGVVITRITATRFGCIGASLVLKATVESTPPGNPLEYRWFGGAVPLTNSGNYSGTRTDSLIFKSFTEIDLGTYTVIVRDRITGAADTANYNLSPNHLSSAPKFISVPDPVAGCQGTTFFVEYEFETPPGSSEVTFIKDGVAFPTKIVYLDKKSSWIFVSDYVVGKKSYRMIVKNHCGADTSDEHFATITPGTKITQPHQTQVNLTSGMLLNLNVTIENAGDYAYFYWYKNSLLVDSSYSTTPTTSSFSIAQASSEDAGIYTLRVASRCGSDSIKVAEVVIDPSSIESYTESSGLQLFQNNPNPFSNETSFSFTIPQMSPVSIIIRDVFGRVLKTIDLGVRDAGNYSEVIKAENWAERTYFYTLQTNTAQLTRSFIIIR
jgi:hypothetical protein